jgi:hypothetical protein|tara:strand:- start:205 stop:801 length:597 start_codon:yes stop_codon:yes gene_type:complete
MPSVVEICNEAMDLLGAATITSLDENSKEARLCNRRFSTVRDAVLRSHPWNCAITRATLSQDGTPPSFGFAHQYTLPTSPFCLRVLSFFSSNVDSEISPYDSQVMFKIEGRKILTDEATCKIIYLARITDTTQFDSLLSNAIAFRLASETAYAITGSNSIAQSLFGLYEQRLREARSMDAVEGKPDRIISEEFTNIRL